MCGVFITGQMCNKVISPSDMGIFPKRIVDQQTSGSIHNR